MLFTSLSFLIFFVSVYILYWSLAGRFRVYFLILASLVFYSAWSLAFTFHFFIIVIINYFFINNILKTRSKKMLLVIIAIDAGNLFFFKYFYLFLDVIFFMSGGSAIFKKEIINGWLFDNFHMSAIALPLAISFYTFQLVAFAMDAYRGKIQEEVNFFNFILFILFFPLVSGPIMRHSEFFPQLARLGPDREKTIAGMFVLIFGFVKKTVFADNMMVLYQDIYINPHKYDWQSNLIAPLAFAIHIYCDFSGYTDIARGLGKLLAFDLPENFTGPFLSRSQQEFWRRWHVTLSSWLRDYIFIPLGGSRSSEFRTNINLIITFTLGGLWHGANYTFLLWGAFHGILISLERAFQNFPAFVKLNSLRSGKTGYAISSFQTLMTFVFFLMGCVFFNSPDINRSFQIFGQIGTLSHGVHSPNIGNIITLLIPIFFMNYLQRKHLPVLSVRSLYILAGVFVFLLVLLMGKFAPTGSEFIYFQF